MCVFVVAISEEQKPQKCLVHHFAMSWPREETNKDELTDCVTSKKQRVACDMLAPRSPWPFAKKESTHLVACSSSAYPPMPFMGPKRSDENPREPTGCDTFTTSFSLTYSRHLKQGSATQSVRPSYQFPAELAAETQESCSGTARLQWKWRFTFPQSRSPATRSLGPQFHPPPPNVY